MGYSSLTYLKRLPVYKLKIDGLFVRDHEDDVDNSALESAVLSIAKRFSLKTAA